MEGLPIRIGRRSDALLARLGLRCACLLSADNPGSRRMPPAWNARARTRLHALLRQVPTVPANGEWRGWSEAHVLVAIPPPRARTIARRFRQRTMVLLRRGAPARLVLIRPACRETAGGGHTQHDYSLPATPAWANVAMPA